jgi:hypothetical protein
MSLMVEKLLERLKNEPVVVAGVLAGVIVFLGGELDIVLDEATIKEAIIPIVTALLARAKVTPNRKL